MRTITIAVLMALPWLTVTAQATSRSAIIARLDSIGAAMQKTSATGVQVAVVKGRDTLLMKGYGFANVELDVPLTPDHVMRIGSLTKQITAAAIMQLADQGKLRLDDPVSKYIARTPPLWSGVRVSHLLTHTSGIRSFTELNTLRRRLDLMGAPPDSMVPVMARDSMMFAPGEGFYYNNGGYYLLGLIIEKASGQTYSDYVARMVAPLGLERTRYCDVAPIIQGRAAGYDRLPANGGYANAGYVDMSTPFSAGAMCSTVRDLVKWSNALHGGRVVKPASFVAMTTPVRDATIRRGPYGMALMSDSIGGHAVIWHNGAINGFSSALFHLPADSLIVAVIANTTGAPSIQVGRAMVGAVLGIPAPRVTLLDLPVTEAERRTLVRKYRVGLPDGRVGEMAITDDNGRLTLRFLTMPPLALYRQTSESFATPGREGLKVWVDIRNGAVREVIYDQGNRPLVGRP